MSTANPVSRQARHVQLIICMVDTPLLSTRQSKQREEETLQPVDLSLCCVSLRYLNPLWRGPRIAVTKVSLRFCLDPLTPILRKPSHSLTKINAHVSLSISTAVLPLPISARVSGKHTLQFLWLLLALLSIVFSMPHGYTTISRCVDLYILLGLLIIEDEDLAILYTPKYLSIKQIFPKSLSSRARIQPLSTMMAEAAIVLDQILDRPALEVCVHTHCSCILPTSR